MTKGRWGASAIIMVSLLAGASARAQDAGAFFGEAHQVVLSTERLFGYTHTTQTTTVGGMDQDSSSDSFSVFSSPLGFASVYSAPRLALDFFAAERFSLGLAAFYFRTSEDNPGGGATPVLSGFLVAPRAGYGAMLSPVVSLWPRLGLSIVRLSTGNSANDNGVDQTMYALTLEAPVVITIAPHVFLSAGPTFDIGLGGSRDTNTNGTSVGIDQKATSLGVQFALGGYF